MTAEERSDAPGFSGAQPKVDDPRGASDRDQIVERLGWSPKQRLEYLLDMLAFEERARGARRVS